MAGSKPQAGTPMGPTEQGPRRHPASCLQHSRRASWMGAAVARTPPARHPAQLLSWWPCRRRRRPGASLPLPAASSGTASLHAAPLAPASAPSSLLLAPRWAVGERGLTMGVLGCSPQADAGARAACAAREERESGVVGGRVRLPAWDRRCNHRHQSQPHPSVRSAAQPACCGAAGHGCKLHRPAVGPPSDSGSGGRWKGGVGSGMGRRRPSSLATAAAAGPGASRQVSSMRGTYSSAASSQGR